LISGRTRGGRQRRGGLGALNKGQYRGGLMRRGGLGTIATVVGGSLVSSSNPIARASGLPVRSLPIRVVGPVVANPAQPQPWGGNPPSSTQSAGWKRRNRNNNGSGSSNWQGGGWNNQYSGGVSQGAWSATSSPYGSSPTNPNNSQALAAAQALLQTNPSLLSPQQFQMLQQAGLVSNTLPYSSVSQIAASGATSADSSSAIDPSTGVPYATELAEAEAGSTSSVGTDLSTTYAGLPLYLWLGGGALLFVLLSRKR
jgi:hypothetical protein